MQDFSLNVSAQGEDGEAVKEAFKTLVRALRTAGMEPSGGLEIGPGGTWYYVEAVDADEEPAEEEAAAASVTEEVE